MTEGELFGRHHRLNVHEFEQAPRVGEGQGSLGVMQSHGVAKSQTEQHSFEHHHVLVNTEIRLIIFFAAKDGEALYSQQKQNQEWTVAWNMKSLSPNSDLS